ncbi:MAG: FG-GAP-like repeat-containing protein [Candidatus Tenebribacter burtonii]|nr:FG-GAP-like repeat-containing protein [Candidatus Tenebribacter burtonii]
MTQIAYLEGEMERSWFGGTMAALDFNGDGYDDLVVSSPQIHWQGRLYFFMGGEVFDDQVDFTLSGVLGNALGSYLTNIGDINGDGKEDLGYSIIDADSLYINILLGNTEQDTIPDFVMSRYDMDYRSLSIRSLGDINNNGFGDVGITWRQFDIQNGLIEYYILWGSNEINDPQLFTECGHTIEGFSGVGDVNDDGYDDFCLGYGYTIYSGRNRLCFGGEIVDTLNSVLLWDDDDLNMSLGLPAGDINNDGYADLAGHFSWDVDIWLGGETINQNFDLTLEYGSGGSQGFGYDYGDFNNDGYSDMVLGSPNFGVNGNAYLYLGNENPNNTVDIEFGQPPGVLHQFGRAVAIGRFDGDEYEDLAIAGPAETNTGPNPGYVYVFAGNGDLEDLVDVEENEIPSVKEIAFNAYPNPFNPTVSFDIKAEGFENLQIEIFNVKGQKIETIPLSFPNQSLGTQDDRIEWNAEKQASGIYLCKLVSNKNILSIKKITLLK